MKDAQSQLHVHRVTRQPSTITATMRPYQVEGLNWLVKLHDNGINGILADEMVRSRRPFHFVVAAETACRRELRQPHAVDETRSHAGPRQDAPINKLTRLPRGDEEYPRPPHLHRTEKRREQLDARDAQVVPDDAAR